MDRLEKAELVREKCGVSYEDAQEALEATGYDVLDAIVWLEQEGRSQTRSTSYTTSSAQVPPTPSPEMLRTQQTYERRSRRTGFGTAFSSFAAWLGRVCRAGVDTTFVAERKGERVIALPALVLVVGLFLWGATIWLLVLGLFLGYRYHVEGAGSVSAGMNDVMDVAAEGVESLKHDFESEFRDDDKDTDR